MDYRNKEGIGMTSMRTRRRLIERLESRGIRNQRVLDVMMNTPRHLFVDETIRHKAYEDTALPIGFNQTISQPFIVALMTEMLLDTDAPVNKVLEIGTGCGYQTAVLSQLVKWVFTVERVRGLQDEAKNRLADLRYRNISYMNADGFLGWESNQPFDGIIVTAAPEENPPHLMEQLSVGGRLVVPVGTEEQHLKVIARSAGGYTEERHEPVRFVPMLQGRE